MNIASVSVKACAKVNLRLAVLGREETGYHAIETLFCGISLCDEIEIRRGPSGIHLEVVGEIDTGPADENLAMRAAHRFFDDAGIPPGVRIVLRKRIPSAAGLGGGSSDAAATLRALNALYDEPISDARLLHIGSDLGSDVPFFLTGSPLAFAWSRGERLLELPALPPRPLLIAHPGVAMPTPAAFSRLAELRGGERHVAPVVIPTNGFRSWDSLALLALNDLEFVAFERIPRLTHAVRALLDAGAQVALLAGSGASIFGIFPEPKQASDADKVLTKMGFVTWQAETLNRWPTPVLGIDHQGENM